MTRINLLTNRLNDPCPPLPKEWPGYLDYFLAWMMGQFAGVLLMRLWIR